MGPDRTSVVHLCRLSNKKYKCSEYPSVLSDRTGSDWQTNRTTDKHAQELTYLLACLLACYLISHDLTCLPACLSVRLSLRADRTGLSVCLCVLICIYVSVSCSVSSELHLLQPCRRYIQMDKQFIPSARLLSKLALPARIQIGVAHQVASTASTSGQFRCQTARRRWPNVSWQP